MNHVLIKGFYDTLSNIFHLLLLVKSLRPHRQHLHNIL
jgi:hypothetical protein